MRSAVDLRERPAERIGLRCEARPNDVLRSSVFGPQRVQCQVPAVGGAGQSMTIARSASSCRPPDTQFLNPAEQSRHVLDAHRIEGGMHLDIEVVADLEPPEELQDRYLAQHHRVLLCCPVKSRGSRSELRPDAEVGESNLAVRLRNRRPASSALRITPHAAGS